MTNGSWNPSKRFRLHSRLVVLDIVIFPGKLKLYFNNMLDLVVHNFCDFLNSENQKYVKD